MTSMTAEQIRPGVTAELRRVLLKLAKRETDLAAAEAARVPYWAPHPPSVIGHRAAAALLAAEADALLTPNMRPSTT